MFKVAQLIVETAVHKMKRMVRYWDKAGTGGGGAYTVGTKMGLGFDGRFCVLDVVRGQWEANERERIIRQTAEIDGAGVTVGIEQEPGSGGKESAQASVRNLAGFRVRVDRPTGDKTMRADPFAVQVNGGNVAILRGAWNRDYIDELQFFPFSTYKDQVDSSSGAFSLLLRSRRLGAM